jgi:predicted phage baseplate assembly protein
VPQRLLTHSAPYDRGAPARAARHQKPAAATPFIELASTLGPDTARWVPKRDLLNSTSRKTHFVVEIESDGAAALRFGDDRHGARPEPGTEFTATYRIGNGEAGNIGADALAHIRSDIPDITRVRNPLPAWGGREPESCEQVRQRAPQAFRRQERAVMPADYAEVAARDPDVQRAAATFRWTGSWHTVFLTVDPRGELSDSEEETFAQNVRRQVERYRMAGYDLEVDRPRYVPLEIEMMVCVDPAYQRSHVRAALLEVFSNQTLPDGRRGLFHPDNFTFGQTVYLSPLYAAAQALPGVASVHITKFQRQGNDDSRPLTDGKLSLDRLEIARLDNDPNFAERGVFRLDLEGGK